MEKFIPVERDHKFAYNIIIRDDFSKLLDSIIEIKPEKAVKLCIVTDDHVAGYYLETVKDLLEDYYSQVLTFVFPSGEEHKNLEEIEKLYEYLIRSKVNRKDMLLALGGGVVGDMTGFAAATFLRGIDFVQIPTTLLSQVDSSIGGKTGVDFLSYKNMIGAFYMPRLVYIQTEVLNTLSEEQFASGMGEVIKYGLIMESSFYSYLKDHSSAIKSRDSEVLGEVIYRSCLCKRQVVEEDPTEQGIRAILNFGHTFGHAIEKQKGFSLFHGQCVAIGMVAAAYLSFQRGYILETDYQDIRNTISSFCLPVKTDGLTLDEVISAMKSDKKAVSGGIRFILLRQLGEAYIDAEVSEDEIRAALGQVVEA